MKFSTAVSAVKISNVLSFVENWLYVVLIRSFSLAYENTARPAVAGSSSVKEASVLADTSVTPSPADMILRDPSGNPVFVEDEVVSEAEVAISEPEVEVKPTPVKKAVKVEKAKAQKKGGWCCSKADIDDSLAPTSNSKRR